MGLARRLLWLPKWHVARCPCQNGRAYLGWWACFWLGWGDSASVAVAVESCTIEAGDTIPAFIEALGVISL